MAYSCNGYFIKLTEQMKPEELLSMAEKLGFGSSVELAPGMSSARETCPSKRTCPTPRLRRTFPLARGTCWLRRCKLPRWSIPSPAAGCMPNRLW
ncbi:MAG: hypothetical protein ACLVHV_16190 [Oscillospiraceae bacterium]